MVCLDLFDKLSIKYHLSHPMKNYTTLKVGGKAKIFIEPKTFKELEHATSLLSLCKIKFKILGNGSNILISDSGYDGAIISTKKLKFFSVNKNEITASCGMSLTSLINRCKELGLSGLERLYGIPATLGGAVCMNAGAFNSQISDKLVKVSVLNNGRLVNFDKRECFFKYRKSRFLHSRNIILSATFSLDNLERSLIDKEIKNCISLRKKSQPSSRSCGSVFKNTDLAPAGLLIDKCNLKGFAIGNASVSNFHSNFINVNDGCTSKEIYELIKTVKQKVKDKFGVTMKEEVEFLGEF